MRGLTKTFWVKVSGGVDSRRPDILDKAIENLDKQWEDFSDGKFEITALSSVSFPNGSIIIRAVGYKDPS